ncbi:LacI family DNA-binding transcriptional regulator [Zhihengliuella halotolerans]|uniref:LacI family transcriptional regulator n=1 Tax=Zhihengliuella halotolerans TaxID=370736 RepID=A0A4Q8AF69_9MICC|nr:LacI family DNA-binding transcriptional regulator [Zhihengliuella halotolerans]RZU62259.1 LacI family transcriptional regulator [Zhihengliuella halotolerans]
MSDTNRQRPATVADVARTAKVSKAQAARALGGYGAVSEPVRQKVLAAAEELNYRPNALARSMNTGRSQTIGVVIGDVENPFFGLATRGLSDTLRRRGYDVVLANTGERVDVEEDAVRVMLDKRVDGLVVSPASSAHVDHLVGALDSGRPMVFLDRSIPHLGVDSVEVDLRGLARQATAELIDAGHRRIGFLSAVDAPGGYTPDLELTNSSVAERLAGIVEACAAAGIDVDPTWIRLNLSTPEAIHAATREITSLQNAPTALIASDSMVGLEVLTTLRADAVRVPDDVSFLMFDDMPWSSLVDPPITVISQPAYDMGVLAAETLLTRLTAPGAEPVRHTLAGRVVHRESVAPVPAAKPVDA